MVDAFHEAGIEVYLDVVFNHTAEGGDDGPTYNFRGVDNTLFYMLDEQGPLPELQRLRQHVQQRAPGRPQFSARLPAQLGHGGSDRRASGSTWRRCWAATGTATCWWRRRWSSGSPRIRCFVIPS